MKLLTYFFILIFSAFAVKIDIENEDDLSKPLIITLSDSSFIVMGANDKKDPPFSYVFNGYDANGNKIAHGEYFDDLEPHSFKFHYSVTESFEENDEFVFYFVGIFNGPKKRPTIMKIFKVSYNKIDFSVQLIDYQSDETEATSFINPSITYVGSSTTKNKLAVVWENCTFDEIDYLRDYYDHYIRGYLIEISKEDNIITSRTYFDHNEFVVRYDGFIYPKIASTENHIMIAWYQRSGNQAVTAILFSMESGTLIQDNSIDFYNHAGLSDISRVELKSRGSFFYCFVSDAQTGIGGFGFTYNVNNKNKVDIGGNNTVYSNLDPITNARKADIKMLNDNGDFVLFVFNDQLMENIFLKYDQKEVQYVQDSDPSYIEFTEKSTFSQDFTDQVVDVLDNGGIVYFWSKGSEAGEYEIRGRIDIVASGCEIGEYLDISNSICLSCPNTTNTVNSGNIDISNCVCDKGYYYKTIDESCDPCPRDSYKDEVSNSEDCTPCLTGQYFEGIGATNILNCTVPSNSIPDEVFIVIGIIAGVFGIVLVCVITFFVISLIVTLLMLRHSRKKANRFDHIEDVDLIMKEAELEQQNPTVEVPKIDVKESNHIIDFKELEILTKIGEGGSNSTVYKADWKGTICAYKAFSEGSTIINNAEGYNKFEEFEKEVAFCVGLNHPSILQFYGASITPNRVGLVIQYCSNGDLKSFLSKYAISHGDQKYPKKEKLRIIKQIILGMEYLHSRKTIHRDLKPGNVLVDEHENAKIMDFGLSRISDPEITKTRRVGTVFYMAPEVIRGGNYGYPCDVYSFAIMVLVLISENFYPYGNMTIETTIMKKVVDDEDFRPQIRKNDFEGIEFLIPIIEKCWDADPEERYNFTELKDIFLKREEEEKEEEKKEE